MSAGVHQWPWRLSLTSSLSRRACANGLLAWHARSTIIGMIAAVRPVQELLLLVARLIVLLRHFPGRDAIVRLADAVPAEQNHEWTVSRHYLRLERSLRAGRPRSEARDRMTLLRLDRQ